tara:strand:- start:139 stop:303 length:165 start_codon:yes stop_codon:yes gene_type:complete
MTIGSFLIWVTNTITNGDGTLRRLELRTKVGDLSVRDARLLRENLIQIIEELEG